MCILFIGCVLLLIGVILLTYLEDWREKLKDAISEERMEREMHFEQVDKVANHRNQLEAIIDRRFNSLPTDYLRVKYTLEGLEQSDLNTLSIIPKALFFGSYYTKIRDDLEEFSKQVRAGRISEYTHDLLKYVAICNYDCYPNGRYNSYYEADEIIYYGKYKLNAIEKNLLEG